MLTTFLLLYRTVDACRELLPELHLSQSCLTAFPGAICATFFGAEDLSSSQTAQHEGEEKGPRPCARVRDVLCEHDD